MIQFFRYISLSKRIILRIYFFDFFRSVIHNEIELFTFVCISRYLFYQSLSYE